MTAHQQNVSYLCVFPQKGYFTPGETGVSPYSASTVSYIFARMDKLVPPHDTAVRLFKEQLAIYVQTVQVRYRHNKSVCEAAQRLAKQLQLSRQ